MRKKGAQAEASKLSHSSRSVRPSTFSTRAKASRARCIRCATTMATIGVQRLAVEAGVFCFVPMRGTVQLVCNMMHIAMLLLSLMLLPLQDAHRSCQYAAFHCVLVPLVPMGTARRAHGSRKHTDTHERRKRRAKRCTMRVARRLRQQPAARARRRARECSTSDTQVLSRVEVEESAWQPLSGSSGRWVGVS